jgi:scyllo-inositol 2-dehydrogenase (NADP+)
MLGRVAQLRAALIGYGLAGASFHAPLIASTPGLAVVGVVTSNPERRERVGRELPGARVLASSDELWQSADDYDLVVVASANDSHVPLARTALDLGLPVVVDKPLAPSAADGRALVDHAEARGVMLTVFQNRRWDSDLLTVRRLIADGTLGRVHRFESRFERWRPRARADAWRETTPAAAGGGVLLDLGPHLVDQALRLFGPVVDSHGEVDSRREGASDDDAFLALRHDSGVVSHLWMSLVAGAPGPRLRVLGSEGAYVVEAVDSQEAALRAGLLPGVDEPWGVEPEARWGRLLRGDEEEAVPSEPGAWPEFYAGVERALRSGEPPPVDPRDAVEALEVIELARDGDRTRTRR